jgi:hypothetical protein
VLRVLEEMDDSALRLYGSVGRDDRLLEGCDVKFTGDCSFLPYVQFS